ncbi:hypothetical protein D3C71_1810430 [compost metagenome]
MVVDVVGGRFVAVEDVVGGIMYEQGARFFGVPRQHRHRVRIDGLGGSRIGFSLVHCRIGCGIDDRIGGFVF